jgi:hypothetical protein
MKKYSRGESAIPCGVVAAVEGARSNALLRRGAVREPDPADEHRGNERLQRE